MTLGHFDKENERLEHLADASAGAAMAEEAENEKKDAGSGNKNSALTRKKKSNWKTQARTAVMAEAAKVFKPQVLNRMNIIVSSA